jgi:hypothetical protein
MPEMKLIAEAILVVIAAALIIWYIITNYQYINSAFNEWIVSLKEMMGKPG